MENQKKCTCPLCQKGDYNSEDFFVDMSFLKKERPIGVTGLLRVKNDADFLSDCIDSCIDALDELIICYQDCTDNAPEIIYKKQQQYPDKIKVYYYAPPILCYNLTEEEKKYAFSLPDTSIHKLCNYYNYTLSKATYRYAVKIDTDQIYFAQKLKRFCDIYRREGSVKMSLGNYLVKYFVKYYRAAFWFCPTLFKFDILPLIPGVRRLVMKAYEAYLAKEIVINKYALSLSGINLGYEQGRWGIYQLNNYPFNGAWDTYIFRITESTYYKTVDNCDVPIESFNYNELRLADGWFWYHLQGMRANATYSTAKEWIPLSSRSKPINSVSKWNRLFVYLWLFFWEYDRDLPDPDKILTETTKNIINRNKSCENNDRLTEI